MRFRKGMIIPVSLLLCLMLFIGVSQCIRTFDDLEKVSGIVNETDSVQVKKRQKWLTSRYYTLYYVYTDAGRFQTQKKVVRTLRRGDQVDVYTIAATERIFGTFTHPNIIRHLEHNNKVLIDYNQERKIWCLTTAGMVLFSAFMIYMMRKRLREDSSMEK